MPEKGLNSAPLFISRPNNWWFSWRFSIWAVSVFLGMLFVWRIDTSAISNGVEAWRNRGDYLGLRPPLLTNSTQFHQHSLRPPNSTLPSQHFVSSNSTILLSTPNDNSSVVEQVVPTHNNNLSWISVDSDPNFTSNLLSQWLAPGGEPCRDSKTSEIAIQNLDSILQFYTGEVHELMIQALDGDGKPKCIGGDYFETDLSSQSWKSRPPIKDFSNGSYSIKLQVHPRFPGLYNLTIVLLFRRFEGLKLSPERFAVQKQLLNLSINFINFNSSSSPTIPQLHQCRRTDFARQIWSGRWTRHARNDNCRIDRDGRFRCLDGHHKCEKTWCYGSLAAIESNGWVYSAHCSFMVFSQLQAWNCLRNRWIFFWGDSNHVDSIRNMLNFVLGLPHIKSVPRRFDTNFTNPFNPSQSVRITSIFNGHYNDSLTTKAYTPYKTSPTGT
ncbi:hypothetical protein Syun_007622 [Stephania yunnanensis]|uniref:Uncharacterized protein n=1 Tax=Stephania yunnanensis TaxID=152371 RepID=A0AAP0KZ22_9MAGN